MGESSLQEKVRSIRISSNDGLYSFLGFFVWPFGLTLNAFKHWDRPWSKNIFWLFCIFFGFTFVIADFGGADSDRYARLFIQFSHSKLGLKELWASFYAEGSDYSDIISPLIMFFVSRFTDNPIVLFIIFGAVFGYFYSRNVWYVLERVNGNLSLVIVIYFLTFILLNPIWNINAFRFSVAAQIFLFGTLPYLLEGKTRNLIWSGVSVLAHFTFLFPLGILGLFYLLKNRLNIYLIFFIATSFIKEINFEWLQSALSFLPDIFFSEVLTYANEDYAEYRRIMSEELPWFVTYSSLGLRWVGYLIVISTYLYGKEILNERGDLKTLLSFSLLLFGFVNIISLVPSGGRFITVANTFLFAYFIIFLTTFPKIGETVLIKMVSIPFLLLFCLVTLRVGMNHFSLMTIIGNPLSAALYSDPVPFLEELRNLF